MSDSVFGSITVVPGLGSFNLGGGGALHRSAPAAPAMPVVAIEDGWRRWVAENVLRGQTPASIVQAMVDKGIDQAAATREVETARTHPYLRAAGAAKGSDGVPASRLAKREWFLENMRRAALQDPQTASVPLVRRPSREQFLHEFYGANRPCLIEDAMNDWPAMTEWTLEKLKARFGERRIETQAGRSADACYEMDSDRHRREMSFGEYIDQVTTCGRSNDFYMTTNNSATNKAALAELWNDTVLFPEYLRNDDPVNRGDFWFGPAGAITPLHHDLTNNLMAQVVGRKLVKLISPLDSAYVYNHRHCFSQADLNHIDYERFPLFRNVRVIDVVLNPGQVLFLPVGWWRHVTGMDISITMTFTNFVFDNDFYSGYTTYAEI